MRYGRRLLAAALLVSLGGCVELFSWSPNGRFLFWPTMDSQGAGWIWDASQGTASKVVGPGPISGGVLLNDDQDMLVLVDLPDNTDKRGVIQVEEGSLYKGNARSGSWEKILERTYMNGFGLSPDRATLYYTERVGDPPQYELRALDLRQPGQTRVLFRSPVDLYFPQVSPSGNQILFTKQEGVDKLCVLPLAPEGAEPTTVLEVKAFWPRWIDDSTFVYIQAEDSDFEKLVLHDLGSGQGKTLYESAATYSAPSVVHSQRAIYAAGLPKGFQGQLPDNGSQRPALIQILRVDAASGEVRQVTDDPLGAMYPSADPTGKRVAYSNCISGSAIAHVLNIETGENATVWRNEEERLYAAALRFQDLKDTAQALSTYQDLINRFPNSSLRNPAWYNTMLIFLRADPPELDAAVLAMAQLSDDLREQALTLFWQGVQPIAADPPNDYIRRYGNEAAANEFKFDTDQTRDLLGLWARWSPSHLYLRVDFAVPHDLQGLGFMDLVLLFNHDSSAGSFRRITPCVDWDLPIEREIWFRHWSTGGAPGPVAPQAPTPGNQYDAEILDGTGNVLARLLGSGFFPAEFPPCQVMGTVFNTDGTGSLVLAIDRNMLQLPAGGSTRIQVCTVKGGVEETQRGLERPRETPQSGQPCCDIADAFGPENSAERVDADIPAGKPAVIQGAAAALTP